MAGFACLIRLIFGTGRSSYHWMACSIYTARHPLNQDLEIRLSDTPSNSRRRSIYTAPTILFPRPIIVENIPPSNSPTATDNLLKVALLGDANLDNKVDLSDLITILNNFGQSSLSWTHGNFDYAPTIDLTDLSDVLSNFGNMGIGALSSTAAPAPEPASLALIALAAPLLLKRRPTHGTGQGIWVICYAAPARSNSTVVLNDTPNASNIFVNRSSVMPLYSLRSSRDTWDSCTPSFSASCRWESPRWMRRAMSIRPIPWKLRSSSNSPRFSFL